MQLNLGIYWVKFCIYEESYFNIGPGDSFVHITVHIAVLSIFHELKLYHKDHLKHDLIFNNTLNCLALILLR